MEDKIEKICVIGSGVMGLAIASLIANSSHQVCFTRCSKQRP
ncbi:3-hydroxyacyl-CoA dehydrogenase NAD-binding domain-containing protein [Candidatus Tisiphia endosymbiont of Dascillus cervinus]